MNRLYLAYGLPAMPLSLMAVTFYVYLPKFYIDSVGLSATAVGIVVLASRVWDAVLDPAVGSLSDHTRSVWGRRRSWVLYSLLPLCLSFALIFHPELIDSPGGKLAWFAIFTFLFFFFWTTLTIPYEALGPELVDDYNERSTLFSYREGSLILGTLLAALIPSIVLQLSEDKSLSVYWDKISYFYLLVLVATTVYFLKKVPERQAPKNVTAGEEQYIPSSQSPLRAKRAWKLVQNFIDEGKSSLSNKHFRVLLIAYTISAFGAALPATLILFYVEYVLGYGELEAGVVLLEYFLIGFLFLPFWLALGRKIGKKLAWIAAMLINAGAFLGVFFLGEGSLVAYAMVVALSAVGYGGSLLFPSSMQADVIDYDEYLSGSRNEGRFVGLWSVAKKGAAAIGTGVALVLLGSFGYEPEVPQTEDIKFLLRVLYALVPSICNLVALVVVCRYSLSEQEHSRIRKVLDSRGN